MGLINFSMMNSCKKMQTTIHMTGSRLEASLQLERLLFPCFITKNIAYTALLLRPPFVFQALLNLWWIRIAE